MPLLRDASRPLAQPASMAPPPIPPTHPQRAAFLLIPAEKVPPAPFPLPRARPHATRTMREI
jgi:hypothetical protein